MNDETLEEIVKALKPPRCPKCGAAVDHLHYRAKELVRADVKFAHGSLEYYNQETLYVDYDTVEYRCPECNEVLFRNWIEAEKFLKEGYVEE